MNCSAGTFDAGCMDFSYLRVTETLVVIVSLVISEYEVAHRWNLLLGDGKEARAVRKNAGDRQSSAGGWAVLREGRVLLNWEIPGLQIKDGIWQVETGTKTQIPLVLNKKNAVQ